MAEDGIWYSEETEDLSYPSEGNELCFSVEENSFWFGHRNNCIISMVNAYPPENRGAIFDIGGGNGFVASGLVNAEFDVVLVEPGLSGCTQAIKRGVKNVVCATSMTAKFKKHSLPAVGLFDVIEHIKDDVEFLQSIYQLIHKGGYLYATVPAYSLLWSDEDDFAGHFKRYTLGEISGVLRSAGFEIEFSSYIFRFLPLPILLLRTIPYRLGLSKKTGDINSVKSSHSLKKGLLTKLLEMFLDQEVNILNNKKTMMFGGSCLIVAKRL